MNKFNSFYLIISCILVLFSNNCAIGRQIHDRFIEEQLSKIEVQEPETHLDYDYSDTDYVKIPIRINEKITTSLIHKSYEGQILNFKIDRNVYYQNNLIAKKGTPVTARIEIITTKGLAGVPAEIFITDFKIPNLDSSKIKEPVSKQGFSMTALILPIKWALTPLPPFGTLTNLIVGFNASLTPNQLLYIDYYPNY